MSGKPRSRVKVHPRWFQVELPSAPAAREQPRPEVINYYLPIDDPCLSILTSRLQSDYPLASEVTFFAGDMDWSGGHTLKQLLYERGWLLVVRHRLQSGSVITDHLVVTGLNPRGPISPDVCQHLTTCSFDRSGSLAVEAEVVAELMGQARQLSTDAIHERHQQRIKLEAPSRSQEPLSMLDLDRKLDAIERQAAGVRRHIAAIPFKTEEYQRLDRELTGIIQNFHATMRQRRALRLQRGEESPRPVKGNRPAMSETRETFDPLVVMYWNLEP
jgi:hypothetical protein